MDGPDAGFPDRPKNQVMNTISIIIPVYNPGPYLVPCLECILAQTVQEWELILVDDGCTDGSGAVCDDYAAKDARIRVIHTPNRGPGAARNTGMDAARGRWFCFIDPDDTVDTDYLEILLSADPVPGSLVMTGIVQHYDDGRPDETVFNFTGITTVRDFTQIDRKFKILRYASPNTKRFDADLIRREGLRFPTEFSVQEDLVFYLDYLIHASQIILVPGVPYHYFLRSGNTSLVSKARHAEEFLAASIAVTDKAEELHAAFPHMNASDYTRFVSNNGLISFVKALYASQDKETYRHVRSEIRKRKRLFFKHFWHGRGVSRNWWALCLAAAGLGPFHTGARYSHYGKIEE